MGFVVTLPSTADFFLFIFEGQRCLGMTCRKVLADFVVHAVDSVTAATSVSGPLEQAIFIWIGKRDTSCVGTDP